MELTFEQEPIVEQNACATEVGVICNLGYGFPGSRLRRRAATSVERRPARRRVPYAAAPTRYHGRVSLTGYVAHTCRARRASARTTRSDQYFTFSGNSIKRYFRGLLHSGGGGGGGGGGGRRRLPLLWPLLLLVLRKKRAHFLACLARRVDARVAVGDEALPALDNRVKRTLRVVAAFLEDLRAELPRAAGRADELLHSKLPRAAGRGDDLHRCWAQLDAQSISLLLHGPSRVIVHGWWRLARKAQLSAGVEARCDMALTPSPERLAHGCQRGWRLRRCWCWRKRLRNRCAVVATQCPQVLGVLHDELHELRVDLGKLLQARVDDRGWISLRIESELAHRQRNQRQDLWLSRQDVVRRRRSHKRRRQSVRLSHHRCWGRRRSHRLHEVLMQRARLDVHGFGLTWWARE